MLSFPAQYRAEKADEMEFNGLFVAQLCAAVLYRPKAISFVKMTIKHILDVE